VSLVREIPPSSQHGDCIVFVFDRLLPASKSHQPPSKSNSCSTRPPFSFPQSQRFAAAFRRSMKF
jgi:hypothetical protein